MIRTRRMMMTALALGVCMSLGACTWATDAYDLVTGPTTAPVANSIDGAASLYVGIAKVADATVKTAACTQPCRDKIAAVSKLVRGDLDAGLDAESSGNSAAVAIALKAFNSDYGSLWTTLNSNGAKAS